MLIHRKVDIESRILSLRKFCLTIASYIKIMEKVNILLAEYLFFLILFLEVC